MQAIVTKYLPATNFKGSRIKASCERGSTIVSTGQMCGNMEEQAIEAANALIEKFVKEDAKRYGTNRNPWSNPRACGQMPNGDYAHVFIPATT